MEHLMKPLTTALWAVLLLLSVCGCRPQSGHTLQAQNQPQVYYPTVNEGVIVPPFLSKGDTIGLVAPAYKDDLNEIKYAIQWLEKQGFHILNGQCIDLHHSTIYSGTDEERAADRDQGRLARDFNAGKLDVLIKIPDFTVYTDPYKSLVSQIIKNILELAFLIPNDWRQYVNLDPFALFND